MFEKFKAMDKQKKIMIIGGIIEALILIFCLIISIWVMTTAHSAEQFPIVAEREAENLKNGAMIGFFQNQPIWFFICICVPVFVIVAIDLIYFAVAASKKESNLSDEQKEMIKKKAMEQARKEMMEEMMAEENNENK